MQKQIPKDAPILQNDNIPINTVKKNNPHKDTFPPSPKWPDLSTEPLETVWVQIIILHKINYKRLPPPHLKGLESFTLKRKVQQLTTHFRIQYEKNEPEHKSIIQNMSKQNQQKLSDKSQVYKPYLEMNV